MKIFRNRTVIGVLCILLALIICFGVTPLFSRSASEKTEIVRVTKDIKEGDEITAEMVQTVEVGAYNLPQNLMTDKKEVVGKYATADLAAGDYILSSKLSAVPAAENAYLYNLDGTKQAISVTIKSFAVGLSGKLESGDIVTVIVADYQGKGETAIPPELQYVEVISVTASSGYDANTGEVVDEKELPSTVTLLVTTEQAKVAQLEKNYGKEGSEIIQDNCQDTIFGGFAPNSQTAEVLSKALGNRTVLSGSVSRGKNDPSQSLQMMERPLLTPDELKSIPKGNFIVQKTGQHPMRTRLRLFLEWGITFEEPYIVPERADRAVAYANREDLERNLPQSNKAENADMRGAYAVSGRGGIAHEPAVDKPRRRGGKQMKTYGEEDL